MALVTSPTEPPPGLPAELLPHLARLDYALDLTYPGREAYGTIDGEINWARCKLREVAGCPPSRDAGFLPPLADCFQCWQFASEYEHWLRLQAAWSPGDGRWDERIEAAAWRRDCWAAAATAQSDSWTVHRRQALLRLYDLCGGRLPGVVPAE